MSETSFSESGVPGAICPIKMACRNARKICLPMGSCESNDTLAVRSGSATCSPCCALARRRARGTARVASAEIEGLLAEKFLVGIFANYGEHRVGSLSDTSRGFAPYYHARLMVSVLARGSRIHTTEHTAPSTAI